MIYALDANTISFLLRPSHNPQVVQKFEQMLERGDDYAIPPICHYEIHWHLLRKKATAQLQVFEDLYDNSVTKLNMSEEDFLLAAKIKAQLEERGTPIGHNDADILIAAYCITNGYTLVTDNTKDFERIEGLQYTNWKA